MVYLIYMNTHADIFFFISSIGFTIFGLLLCIGLFYFIRTMRTISLILEKAKAGVDNISDTAEDMLFDIQDSTIYRMLFGKRSHKKRQHVEK